MPEFIEAVHPKVALISVGRHNLFGHPAPLTIETLRAAGAQIYRTDKKSAIMLSTDGSALNVRTMLGP